MIQLKPDFDPVECKMINVSNEEKRYDFIAVGAGAAGSVLAAELSASGAQVLVCARPITQSAALRGRAA
jgi:predicted oxidoreductase